jgi:hypothetical protein
MGVFREKIRRYKKNYNINICEEAEIKIKMISSTEICTLLGFYAE